MKFEVNFNDDDTLIVQRYMKETNMTISEIARQAILEMIFQDDADLYAYERALEEYKKNPNTYTYEEVCKVIEERGNYKMINASAI